MPFVLSLLALLAPASAGGPAVVVENRFAQKEGRFEIAPAAGFVPNDPIVQGRLGSVGIAWHAGEELAVEGTVAYSPLLGPADLKPVPLVVLGLAPEGTEQRFDKVELASSLGVRWAPLYGKISVLGDKVVSFDVYGYAGAGMLARSGYVARREGEALVVEPTTGIEAKLATSFGAGSDVFVGRSVALKLDARAALYVDGGVRDHFTASAGLGFYFPKSAATRRSIMARSSAESATSFKMAAASASRPSSGVAWPIWRQ